MRRSKTKAKADSKEEWSNLEGRMADGCTKKQIREREREKEKKWRISSGIISRSGNIN